MEFIKEIKNEEDYLNFIFKNNYINLPVVKVDEITGLNEYVMIGDMVVKAVDFQPKKPCKVKLVAFTDNTEDNDSGEITYRMLQIEYNI